MPKQICVNGQQKMLLDSYLGDKENFPILDYKTYEEIAEIAAEHFEFPISPSTVRGIRNQKIECGFDVWEVPLRKIKTSLVAEVAGLKKQNAEQESLITRLYARVSEIEKYMEEEKEYTVLVEEFDRKQGGGNGTALAV